MYDKLNVHDEYFFYNYFLLSYIPYLLIIIQFILKLKIIKYI